jgi:hypothetical protein
MNIVKISRKASAKNSCGYVQGEYGWADDPQRVLDTWHVVLMVSQCLLHFNLTLTVEHYLTVPLIALQWYTGARQKLQGGLKQFLATAGREAGALRELCEKVQVRVRGSVRGRVGVTIEVAGKCR